MPACGSNALTPRLRRAIGYSVGTSAEMRGDICSIGTDSSSAVPKDSAGLSCQRESCKKHTRQALVPACGQNLRSERAVRTSWPVALPERSLWPLYPNMQSARPGPASGSAHGATCGPMRTPARETAINAASMQTLAKESALSMNMEEMIPWGHSDEQGEGVQTAQGAFRRHPAMRGRSTRITRSMPAYQKRRRNPASGRITTIP